MGKNKISIIVYCLLVACLASIAGVTYARYQSTIDAESLNFTSISASSICVYGGSYDEEAPDNSWKPLSDGWTQGDKIANWVFFVTNGKTSESYATRTQACTVELVSGVGSENMVVELTYTTKNNSVIRVESRATAIAVGSAMYSSYGEGYVHKFFDSEGNELKFELEGEKFSYQNFVITVSEAEQVSLLDLRVNGEYVNKTKQ